MKTILCILATLCISLSIMSAGTSDFSVRMESSSGSSLKPNTMSSAGSVSLNGLPPGSPLRCVVTWNGVQYGINVAAGDVNGDGVAEMRAQNNNTVRSNRTDAVSPRDAASGLPTGKRMHKPYTLYCALDASNPTQVSFFSTEQEAVQACKQKFSATSSSRASGGGAGKVSVQDFHFVMKIIATPSAGGESVSFNFQKIEMK